ncbi:MAG TPA: MFS transporter [Mobilitalea sp.]|nr:MFS transporter [Mobilitalea sp.]
MNSNNKLFNGTYLLLTLVNLITAFGFSMIASIVSSYAVSLGAGLTLAGTLAGVFSLSALVIRPFSGMALDILNKRNMCIFSTIMICVSFVGYSFAQTIPVMLFFRVLHGMSFGISSTSTMALVSGYIPKERLGEGLGYFGLGQIISRICGPYIGIVIKDRLGYQKLFILISLLTILAVVLLFWVKVEKTVHQSIKKIGNAIRIENLIVKDCIVYALVAGLFSLVNGITSSFLVLLGEERGISNIALFFSVNAIVLLILRFMIGRLIDKFNLTPIVIMSLLITGLSMFMIGMSSGIIMILFAAALVAIGQGTGQLSLQSACIRRVDAAKVGVATSTYYIGADIGQGLGPIIGGKVSELYNYRMMFYLTSILMLGGIVVFIVYQIYDKKKVNNIY